MTTTTLTLAAFLLARQDEDEAAATMHRGDAWHIDGRSWRLDNSNPMLVGGGKILATLHEDEEPAAGDHIVRWNPARVLAEVAAKRAIVELSRWIEENPAWENDPDLAAHWADAAATLRALASVYRDHDEWREEWG